MKPYVNGVCERKIEVKFLNGKDSKHITLGEKLETVEDVCFQLAKELNIGPLCRHLFSLQIHGTENWLYPGCVLQRDTPHNEFIFRQRFKTAKIDRIKEVGDGTLDYHYLQVRHDMLNKNVRGLDYQEFKSEILGLSVADMYRVTIETDRPVNQVKSDYKKFIPKVILKNQLPYLYMRKEIYKALENVILGRHRPITVKESYLNEFHNIAPEYMCEEFVAYSGDSSTIVRILVNPYFPEFPGILVRNNEKEQWQHVCTIEDLIFVSIRNDLTIELSRNNGIPVYYTFQSEEIVYSFVSLLDGYYRLTKKWTFNLCNNIISPILTKLHSFKCHGPVGSLFSDAKLLEKCDNAPGAFILRESERSDSVYFLDVCVEGAKKPRTYRIHQNPSGSFTFLADGKIYSTLTELIKAYKAHGHPEFKLNECVPPSEFDKSQALICATDSWANELAAVTNPEEFLLSSPPQLLSVESLQVFPTSKREGRCGKTLHHRAMWKHNKRSRVQAAIKELKPELEDKKLLTEFLELSGRWGTLQSNMIVKLYGVTLTSKICMVTEYLYLGSLDAYLEKSNKPENKAILHVDLVEAAASLAKAMWQMEEAGMTHGYIRCRKLLVAAHDDNTFRVKLSDPGLHKLTEEDIPWIPPECYSNLSRAKSKTSADVWAYGTTLWEIFSMGKRPEVTDRSFYQGGGRLPQPPNCPLDIYKLILDCWNPNLYSRKRPQEIMRDIHLILFQAFNSRRQEHSYEKAYSGTFPPESIMESVTESGESFRSDLTGETVLEPEMTTEEPLIPLDPCGTDTDFSDSSYGGTSGEVAIFQRIGPYSQVTADAMTSSSRRRGNQFFAEAIYQLGQNCNVVLQGCIGRGSYGDVYKGLLECAGQEPQHVAVKKIKPDAVGACKENLMKEIELMPKLKHPNIVQIVGVIHLPDISLVMEYVPLGSLSGYIHRNKDSNMEVLKRENLLRFCEDIAKGMEYLVAKKVVHRDLAARNILVATNNHVKISDFGLAQVVDGDYYVLRTYQVLPIKWYAPECLQRDYRFSHRSDVWSYGVTLYEMFSLGKDPRLPGMAEQIDAEMLYEALVVENKRLPCPDDSVSDIYRDIMRPCWEVRSKDRPSFTQLLSLIRNKLSHESCPSLI